MMPLFAGLGLPAFIFGWWLCGRFSARFYVNPFEDADEDERLLFRKVCICFVSHRSNTRLLSHL